MKKFFLIAAFWVLTTCSWAIPGTKSTTTPSATPAPIVSPTQTATVAPSATPILAQNVQHFFIHTGVIALNSFGINPPPANSGGPSTINKISVANPFLEVVAKNRLAWNYSTNGMDSLNPRFNGIDAWFLTDQELTLGYAFSGNEGSTGVVTGAGQAFLEFNASLITLYAKPINEIGNTSTLNLEGLYGFTTDSYSQQIHNYFGVGPVFVLGIPTSADQSGQKVQFLSGLYASWFQVPDTTLGSGSTIIINSNELGLPQYRNEQGIIGRVEFDLPISTDQYLTAEGRFGYPWGGFWGEDSNDLDPLTLKVGWTISTDTLANSIKAFAGAAVSLLPGVSGNATAKPTMSVTSSPIPNATVTPTPTSKLK